MSDDIVERLMICARYDPDQKEAASEIERLRAEHDALRALLREAGETLFAATVLISDQGFNDDAERETLARIDRALKGDGDEME